MGYRERIYEKYATSRGLGRPLSREEADRHNARYLPYIRDLLPADRNAAILDVACGNGRLCRLFMQAGFANVLGVDVSADQLELARHLDVKVEQGDVLPYLAANPGRFDLITGVDVIEHLTRDEVLTFLDRSFAALRPGGRLVVQTPNGASLWRGEIWHSDFTHETCFTPALLGQLMGLSGFVGYSARELGPVPHGPVSAARWALWKLLRLKLMLLNMIESGSPGGNIYTRVFIGTAVKPQ